MWRSSIALFAGAILLTSCGSGGSPQGGGTKSPSPKPTDIIVVPLGRRQTTAKGSVVVYAYDRTVAATASRQPAVQGDIFIAFDIEGCAGPNADKNTGVTPGLFYLQIGPYAYNPVDPVQQPALHDTVLAPNRCARGWVTFEIPKAEKPQFILFRGNPRTAWRLPR